MTGAVFLLGPRLNNISKESLEEIKSERRPVVAYFLPPPLFQGSCFSFYVAWPSMNISSRSCIFSMPPGQVPEGICLCFGRRCDLSRKKVAAFKRLYRISLLCQRHDFSPGLSCEGGMVIRPMTSSRRTILPAILPPLLAVAKASLPALTA